MRGASSLATLGICLSLAAGHARAATVTLFASNVYQNLYGITADSSGVYVSGSTGVLRNFNNDPANGVIGRIPFDGSGLTTLYSQANYNSLSGHVAPFQIATDGKGKLIWADPDAGPSTGASFLSGTTSGAAPTRFFAICCGAGVLPGDGIGVALAGGSIYFSDGTGGRVGKNPSGGAATQIGATRYGPDFTTEAWSQIAVKNGTIFLADSAQQRGEDANTGRTLVVDESASIKPAVRAISIDGTSGFRTLSIGIIPHPQGIAAAAQVLYVTSGNTIWKVNQTTGKTTKLISSKSFQDLQGIVLFKGALYVADIQNKFGPFAAGQADATSDLPGVIWKVIP